MSALDDVLDRIADELVDRVLVRVADRLAGREAKNVEGGGVISRPPVNGTAARRAAVPARRAPKQLPAAPSTKTSAAIQKDIDDIMRFVEKAGAEGMLSTELGARFASMPNLRSRLQKARALKLLRMTGTKRTARYYAL